MRFALIVEYDGTDFSGSQFQLNARTVQGVLENAAQTIFGPQIDRVRMASRTDAGVHAFAQVAAIDLETEMTADEMINAFNGNLPDDVSVKAIQSVPDDFDPRRSAIAREYRYVINDTLTSSPLRRRYEYSVRRHLDTEAMATAANMFIGIHDFASFAAATTNGGSTTRRVDAANIYRSRDERIIFDIRANAFLRQQIRRMVATLIAIGDGSKSADWLEALITYPRKNGATQNAPPHALTLMRVEYEANSGMPKVEGELMGIPIGI